MDSNAVKILGLATLLVAITALSSYSIAKKSGGQNEGLSKKQVERIVSSYIEDNPQQIIDSLSAYQQKTEEDRSRNAARTLIEKKDDLENNPADPIVGNVEGDVTIVEFFDYSCGYCKRAFPDLAKIIEEDSGVKVVFKEFPILGPNSVLASKAALAVHLSQPSKYLEFHGALMKERISSKEAILKIATDVGVDNNKMIKFLDSDEVQNILDKNRSLAESIGVRGTPAFITRGKLSPGALSYAELKKIVESARAQDKAKLN